MLCPIVVTPMAKSFIQTIAFLHAIVLWFFPFFFDSLKRECVLKPKSTQIWDEKGCYQRPRVQLMSYRQTQIDLATLHTLHICSYQPVRFMGLHHKSNMRWLKSNFITKLRVVALVLNGNIMSQTIQCSPKTAHSRSTLLVVTYCLAYPSSLSPRVGLGQRRFDINLQYKYEHSR